MQALLRTLISTALLATAIGAVSCSKDQTTAPINPDPMSQNEADDVMTQVGQLIALDNSGWLKEITATVEGTDGLTPPPTRIESDSDRPDWATLRDTSFTENGMNYSFNYVYIDTLDQEHTLWVPGVFLVEGLVNATGTIVNSTFNGTFDHNGDLQADFRDLQPDFIEFDGFSEDTSLGFMRSPFRADSSYWFMDIFYDYDDVRMNRNYAAAPYPLSGLVDMDIDAFALNSPNITDIDNHVEAVVTISFNNTVMARATIEDDFETALFTYDINIQTGEVTRVVVP